MVARKEAMGLLDLQTLQLDFDGRLAETLEVARTARATPAELRDLLLALQEHYDQRLALIEQRATDDLTDAIGTFRKRRLDRFVPHELAAYIEAVTPRGRGSRA
jgi:hypothetical protein